MIAQFLYKNPSILFLTLCVICAAGISSFIALPRLEDPVLGQRVAIITTAYPGADSRRVESLVTLRLEERLRGISEIDQVRSTSRTGISNIVIELQDAVTDVEAVWSVVRDRLTDVETDLPEQCLRPEFEVLRLKAFAAIVAIQWREAPENPFLLRRLAGHLRTRIENLIGTEAVQAFGDTGEEYVAEIDAEELVAMGLSTGAIAAQVVDGNVTHPAGYVRSESAELLLDLDAGHTARRLGESIIRFGPGHTAALSEIATIDKSLVAPASDVALINGRRAIVLGAFVDDRLRVDRWSAELQRVLEDFQQDYAAEVDTKIIFSQHEYVEARLNSLLRNLVLGGAAVVVVVFLLMGWRSMIVVGASLPLSALMVLTGMRLLQIPLHQMSVTGLIVALGLLIDNAIVIVEDVRARVYHGASVSGAILDGVRHLAMPLFGSTLTTALAFMPIATLPGPPGEFVGTIAISVILAIGSSFVLAMTVVPALLAMMRVDAGRGLASYGITSRSLEGLYRRSLSCVFRFPALGILIGGMLPLTGFAVVGRLPEQFFPPSDRNQIQIEVELPAREPAEETLATVADMQKTVTQNGRVKRCDWFLGRSAPTFFYNVVPRRRGTPFYAQAYVQLRPDSNSRDVVRELQTELDEKYVECRVIVRQLEQGPPFDAPIEIRVAGPDLLELQRLGSQLRLLLSETPNVIHTRSDSEETVPKLIIDISPRDAMDAGLSKSEIAQLMYATLEGAPAGTILEGEEEVAVRIKMAGDGESRLNQLAALQLPTSSRPLPSGPSGSPPGSPPGGPPRRSAFPPLAAIADFELSSDVAAINRINGKRTNEVKAYIRAGVLPSIVLAEFRERLANSEFRLPLGYTMQYAGERAERSSAVSSLIANAVLLFALMILTLVVTFRSFRDGLIILAVGGLTIGLGPLSLWIFGFPFGFMAIVGTMGLVGVAINDSIVVLASISANPAARRGDLSELIEVVVGCTRHVLATTFTTISGFTPLILAGGGFWPPLAITIAGGVSGATILALFCVPSLNLVMYRSQGDSAAR